MSDRTAKLTLNDFEGRKGPVKIIFQGAFSLHFT